MKIRAIILSCAERADVLKQTLANLAATDWGEEPRVFLDTEAASNAGVERKQERQSNAAAEILELFLREDTTDYLLFLEDDLDFNRHLRANLMAWTPLRAASVFLASLYNPNIKQTVICQNQNWFQADAFAVYGSQAFIVSRKAALEMLKSWDDVEGMQDIKMSRIAAKCGEVIYYHMPSLVQHVGGVSTWGGVVHQASDFAPDFKAAPLQEEPCMTLVSAEPRPARLLCLCDSPTVETGFGRVAQNLIRQWHNSGRFPGGIDVWGIGYGGFPHELPCRIFPAVPAGAQAAEPWNGSSHLGRFLSLLDRAPEDGGYTHVWIMQDTWRVRSLAWALQAVCKRRGIRSLMYFPVDADLEPEWTDILAAVDVSVAYCGYGASEAAHAMQRNPKASGAIRKLAMIPHGVDPEIYRPLPLADQRQIRAELFGGAVKPEDFLMVCVSQNARRKGLAQSLRVLATVNRLLPTMRAKLYLHMDPVNPHEGIDLRALARQIPGTEGAVIFADEWFHRGFPKMDEHGLNKVYNAADLLLTTTLGEGWGLPLIEAMAAGTAVAGPKHTSVAEILEDDRGILFDIGDWDVQPHDNSRLRPRVDVMDAAEKICRHINAIDWRRRADQTEREIWPGEQWARSEALSWSVISKQWLELFFSAK